MNLPKTREEVLELLSSGVRIKFVPKSVAYDEVIGGVGRLMYVGKRMVRTSYPLFDVLYEMQQDKLVRFVERRSGVGEYVLCDDCAQYGRPGGKP